MTETEKKRIFVPLRIPVARRRQTFAVLIWALWIPLSFLLCFLCATAKSDVIFYSFAIYVVYIFFFQTFHEDGGRRLMWARRAFIWRWMGEYFPVSIKPTCKLPPDRKYIFGYHPHGTYYFCFRL